MTVLRRLGELTDPEWYDVLDEFVGFARARRDAFGLDAPALTCLFDAMTAEREKARRAYLVERSRSKWAL